jgi:uncharacterized membrane protein (UPF0127 family)
MRNLLLVGVLAAVLAACSSADEAPPTTAASQADPTTTSTIVDSTDDGQTTTTASVAVPPQLADHDLDIVVVGDRLLLLAIADSPGLRAQGLMGVTDLGDLDGMLFYWRHEASGGFWMEDTLIPLDIVWFNEDGTYAGRASMVPCIEDPCPLYSPEGDPDFRYAIEAPAGNLDWIDESTVIVYSD